MSERWKTFGVDLVNPRLTKIDGQALIHHSFLTDDDICFYLWEYTSQKGYSFSRCNQLITNLKKSPTFKNSLLQNEQAQYQYKLDAIFKCADTLSKAISPDMLKSSMFVPVPCSKRIDDPEYDDRMEKICKHMDVADLRKLVVQTESRMASHMSAPGERQTISDLIKIYQLNEELCCVGNIPKRIIIIDDVLTTGRHFKAMQAILQHRFPDAKIIGVFIARRIFDQAPDDASNF